jgi:peroxiredoxin
VQAPASYSCEHQRRTLVAARGSCAAGASRNPLEQRRIVRGIWEHEFPRRVVLACGVSSRVDVSELACQAAVFYFYPGCAESLQADAVEHRAFRDARVDLAAAGFIAVGVSTQCPRVQAVSISENALDQLLLSDPGLELAGALGLPTCRSAGGLFYERVTIVVKGHIVERVCYPVDPWRSAAQVLGWLRP